MSIIAQDRDSKIKAWITALYTADEAALNGQRDQPIATFRKRGYEELLQKDFPTRKDEDWKYTNVAPIIKKAYKHGETVAFTQADLQPYLFDGLEALRIVIINGVLRKDLSNLDKSVDGLTVMRIEDALLSDDYSALIEKMIRQPGGTDQNPFLEMNRAFGRHGYFLLSEKNVNVDLPVHFMYINTLANDDYFVNPQIFASAKEGSQLTFIESYHHADSSVDCFTNAAKYVQVGTNAHVHHYRLQFDSIRANQINNTIVTQGKDSTYSNYAVDLGGKTVRNNLSTELLDSGTMTHYYGAYLGLGDQHIDNQTFIDHAMPHCDSNELYKGILSDKARGVFNGKVLVRQDAQKTNAFQQNSSLVLSDTAIMDAKPQLEIYADDVKCSHGATIGQLDESSVFYLKSRGLPDAAAKNLLQKAFVGEVVINFGIEAIKDDVLRRIDHKLERKS